MKYIFQLGVIMGVSFLGEVLNRLIPLPVPASIYGLVLMFLGLLSRAIPLEWVRGTGKFLIAVMPVMFVPAAVGLMDSWGLMRAMLAPLAVISVVSTFAVMGVSGRVAQAVLRRRKGDADK